MSRPMSPRLTLTRALSPRKISLPPPRPTSPRSMPELVYPKYFEHSKYSQKIYQAVAMKYPESLKDENVKKLIDYHSALLKMFKSIKKTSTPENCRRQQGTLRRFLKMEKSRNDVSTLDDILIHYKKDVEKIIEIILPNIKEDDRPILQELQSDFEKQIIGDIKSICAGESNFARLSPRLQKMSPTRKYSPRK